MKPGRIEILIADDVESSRVEVREALHGLGIEPGIADIHEAGSPGEVLARCGQRPPDLVILDLCLDPCDHTGESGLEVLRALRARQPAPEVVVISQRGEEERLCAARGLGAGRYVIKPVTEEGLRRVLASLRLDQAGLGQDRARAPSLVDLAPESAPPRLGGLRREVEKVARFDVTLLLLGPSGAGKELLAEEIHRQSGREGEFVHLQIDGLPPALVLGELFGWVKGAFSGATTNRKGLVAQAEGGTLFLDEIGDLPLDVQSQVLRLIDKRRYRPIGQNSEKEARCRLVAATNRDLRQMVREGRFRQDLLYRLDGQVVRLPSLCDRLDDLEWLVPRLLGRLEAKHDLRVFSVGRGVMEALRRHPWPGNVRELEHALERALIAAAAECPEGPLILGAQHVRFPEEPDGEAADEAMGQGLCRRKTRKENIERLVANQILALRAAGLRGEEIWTTMQIDRSTYHRLMNKLNLRD